MAVALSGTAVGDINKAPQVYQSQIQMSSFGPYAATQADVNVPLFAVRRPIVIESIDVICGVKPSVGSNFNVFRRINGTDTAVSDAVTAARKIITTFDLNTLTNKTITNLPLAQADTSSSDTTQKYDNNVLQPGDSVVLDFATTTAMADLFVMIRWRYQDIT